MASMATTLGVVNLSLELASIWSLAFLIFLGTIGFAVVAAVKKRRNRSAMPSTATILGAVILSQGMASASGWSTASLIFCRIIALAAAAAGRADSESSSSSSGINYEVFLSFRGKDTRKGFTDHLYSRLVDAGIQVFRDNEDLRTGEGIKPQLIEAIKGSKISIAVFSKDYASSRSCLMEVVQMWECKIFNGQTIIPIFYDISPNDVKRQAGEFETSFKKHEQDRVDSNTIRTWKEVLRKIGGLSGFNREEIKGGHESQLVKEVLTRVWQVLKKDDQVVTDKLVGIDLHVQEVMRKLGVVYSDGQVIKVCGGDVRVVGIWGMRGIGKTTIARVVYNKMHMLFDGCSFLEDMKLEEVVSSQERLIASLQKIKREALNSYSDGITKMESQFSKMKVLIVLDDVREVKQIKGLAGKLTWFGPGSKIIVTTDRREVLYGFDGGVVDAYDGQMRHHHALQLFREHAFEGDAPQDVFEFDSLSIDIVEAIGRHPKAIILQASFLSQKRNDIETWRYTLDFLRRNLPEGVKPLFDIGYESLDHRRKKIFLDIACFFVGKDKRIPTYMWKACDCYPPSGVDPLRSLQWLEIGENNEIRMDNLIRDFGRDIVKSKDVHERCRFWNYSDRLSILENRMGTKSVEGIGLTVEDGGTEPIKCEEFREMSNLRYLKLDRANIQGNVENLPPSLRWLDWRECHFIPDLHDTHLKKLVILDLSRSLVTRDPKIWSRIREVKELEVLNLQGCGLSSASLKFSAPIDLEMLILEDSTWLSEIGPFISKLKKLRSLNLRKCSLVKKLPQEPDWMESLRELLIDGTGIKEIKIDSDSLKELQELSARGCTELGYISPIGHLTKLESLALDGAKINLDPETFEFPQNLQRLSLRECRMVRELPPSIGKLGLLEVMDLSDTGIEELPPSVKCLTNLKTLKMEGTPLRKFPEDLVNLKKLEEIDFSRCTKLEAQDCWDISGLSSLRILRLSSSIVAGLPQNICRLSRLQTLDIFECDRLQALPKLPSSLQSLRWGCPKMTVPDLSYLTNLKELRLKDVQQPTGGLLNLKTPKVPDIGWIARLTSLETLELSPSNVTNLPGNFSALTQLRQLSLSYMKEPDLTQLPSSPCLSTLRLKHCKIPEPKFSSLKYLSELKLHDCNLAEIDGLEDLERLEVLKIFYCRSITDLNGLKDLPRLRKVKGIFSAYPSLPIFSHPVELDILAPDSSESVAYQSLSCTNYCCTFESSAGHLLLV